eukprot:30288_1
MAQQNGNCNNPSKKRKLNPIDIDNHPTSTNPIVLNVGGVRFWTTLDTLLAIKDSYFEKMFGGRFNTNPVLADGSYFIDRDGEFFMYILNHLRSGIKVVLPDKVIHLKKLQVEADYYNLSTLVDLVKNKLLHTESTNVSSVLKESLDSLESSIESALQDLSNQMPYVENNDYGHHLNSIDANLRRIANIFGDSYLDVKIRDH